MTMLRVVQFRLGDWVMYEKPKCGAHPTPRAKDVRPSSSGETYEYFVDKFWRVEGFEGDRQIIVKTRTGKQHVISIDDPRLRAAKWWEIMLYRRRFLMGIADVQTGMGQPLDNACNVKRAT